MDGPKRDTKRTTPGLTGAALERAVMELAWSRPDLVAFAEAERLPSGKLGRIVRLYPQDVSRPGPLPRGNAAAIAPAALRAEWARVIAELNRDHVRITYKAIGVRLEVSARTAQRYRKRYALPMAV